MPAYDINSISASEQDLWNSEWIKDYSVTESVLTTLVSRKGIEVGFETVNFTVVQDDGVARARTRTGEIPYRNGGQAIVSATLEEAADGIRIPNFQAFKSSVDQRGIAMMQVKNSIQRSMNTKILDILAGYSTTYQNNSGNAEAFTAATVDNELPVIRTRIKGGSGRLIGLLTEHAFVEYERQNTVSSTDYIDAARLPDGVKAFKHRGVEWYRFPEMPGAGTATASCYIFDSAAIEYHARDEGFIADYDKQHRRHFCNALVYQAGVIALPKGVVFWKHDDTATFS